MKHHAPSVALVCLLAFASGCGTASNVETSTTPTTDIDGSHLVLPVEPEGAQDIIVAREKATDGDEIAVVGRIGGSLDPWVKDRAAFSLVDLSLKACSDVDDEEDCSCPTPWDYCCEVDKLPTRTVFVKFTDDNGRLIEADARPLFGVKALDTIVVQGTAKRDDAGNLTVVANGLFKK